MPAHPVASRPTGYRKGRARREAIIAVAAGKFAQAGFRNSSMVEIAAECGISRAGLLHHFPTKESLLEAVLEARDAEDHARFRANGSANGDPLNILRGMVDLARHNSSIPGMIELYTLLSAEATAPDHPAHDYFVSRYERIRAGTTRALTRAKGSGLLRADSDPESLAIELIGLMDGLQIQWLLDRNIDMAGRLESRIQSLLTVSLTASAGSSNSDG